MAQIARIDMFYTSARGLMNGSSGRPRSGRRCGV